MLSFASAITTAAMDMLGKQMGNDNTANECRFPEIMADAAYVILTKDSKSFTGQFCVDEDVLKQVGVTDFEHYAVKPGNFIVLESVLLRSILI